MRTIDGGTGVNRSTLGAWATAGVALWVSLGELDVTAAAGTVRIAMLPHPGLLAAAVALALLTGWVLYPRLVRTGQADSVLPLYALSVLALPYLPWLPDAVPLCRVFAGPARYLIWLGVIGQVVWAAVGAGRARRAIVQVRAWQPVRLFAAVWVASLLVLGAAALVLAPSGLVPGGDEPHYLVITQSLLTDGDLDIENNHARGDYRAYYGERLEPHALARGVNGALYSVHPPALAVLVAPAFALGGYPLVVAFLVLLAALAAALAWMWVRGATGSMAAATFGWAASALGVSFVYSAGTVYPDTAATLPVMLAVGVGLSARVPSVKMARGLLIGAAAALLPWLSSKYAPMSAAIVGVACARVWFDDAPARVRRMAAVVAPYVVSLAAWFAFFQALWGSPWPSAPYGGAAQTQMSAANLIRGVPGLLFDQEYGLLSYAPVLAMAAVGFWGHWRAGGTCRRQAVELAAILAALGATVAGHQMWWGGTSVPARFLVPGILLLALPVAWAYRHAAALPDRRAGYRLLLLVSLATTVAVALSPGASALANRRDGMSRLYQWLSPDWHLWAYAPDYIAQPLRFGVIQTALWMACLGLCALAAAAVFGRGAHPGASRTGRGLAFLRADAALLAAVVAVTLISPLVLGAWLKPDVAPADRARIRMLDTFDPHARPFAVVYDPFTRIDAADVPARFELTARPGSRRAASPVPLLLNARFALPAGRYTVRLTPGGDAPEGRLEGHLALQGGRHGGALAEWRVKTEGAWQDTFDLPVDVSFVGLRASDGLAAATAGLSIMPARVMPTLDRIAAGEVLGSTLLAGRFVFLFHDGASYPESNGFWVRGEAGASISVLSRTGRLTLPVRLRLRNGPRPNVVRITTPADTQEIRLGPRETKDIRVAPTPLDGTLRMIVHPERGFVPSRTEPGNSDDRLLGCWVEVVG